MKILIADDHEMIVDGLALDLEEIVPDAEITCTTSAEEVIRLFAETSYDIVFLDIDMPVIDGLTIGRMLMTSHPHTNIIYITGYEKYALESYDTNPSAFLVKPITEDKIRFALEHLRYPVGGSVTDEMLAEFYAGGSTLAKGIRMCREKSGISRERLANLIGVSVPTVFRWENGTRTPDTMSLLHLSNVLRCSLDELLGE